VRKAVREDVKKTVIVVGGSHACNMASVFEEKGYNVIKICKSGFRAVRQNVTDLQPLIAEGLKDMGPDDMAVVQCLDNTAYFARTEDGGDQPVKAHGRGEHHVEGDLVLASPDRQRMQFETLEPILQMFGGRKLFVLTPMPRWLYSGCCRQEDHAPNRRQPGFEQRLRDDLRGYWQRMKTHLFVKKIKAKVLDPSPVLTYLNLEDEELWGNDAVHPRKAGYQAIAALIEKEAAAAANRGKKRPGDASERASKRPRVEMRPTWIQEDSESAVRRDWARRGGHAMVHGGGGGATGGWG